MTRFKKKHQNQRVNLAKLVSRLSKWATAPRVKNVRDLKVQSTLNATTGEETERKKLHRCAAHIGRSEIVNTGNMKK